MKKVLLMGIFLILKSLLGVTGSFATGEGGDPLAFLKIGVGARPLSLGKAFTAVADSANAAYWNPAGLTQVERPELSFMYSQPYLIERLDVKIPGVSYHTLSAALPFGVDVIGVNIIYLGVTGIEEVTPEGRATGNKFSNTEMAILTSYARKVSRFLSFGANVKGIYQKIYSSKYSDTGFGLDIGVLLMPYEVLKIGVSLHDLLAPTLRLNREEERLPLKLLGGIAYSLIPEFLIAISVKSIPERSLKYYLGLEYQFTPNISVRGGYSGDNEEISGGIGFSGRDFQIDLGFSSHTLGGTPRASLTLRF